MIPAGFRQAFGRKKALVGTCVGFCVLLVSCVCLMFCARVLCQCALCLCGLPEGDGLAKALVTAKKGCGGGKNIVGMPTTACSHTHIHTPLPGGNVA